MEARSKQEVSKKKRVHRKLRQRAIRRTMRRVRDNINAHLERQMRWRRMSLFNPEHRQHKQHRTYHVKHDYTVEPVDPYEGENLFNIDHMDD